MNDEGSWEYKPDGKTAAAAPELPSGRPGSSATAKKTAEEVSWTASEYIDHSRGAGWYLALVAGTVVLAGLVYLVTKDYFALGVVAFLGIIVAVFSTHRPKQVQYALTAAGL